MLNTHTRTLNTHTRARRRLTKGQAAAAAREAYLKSGQVSDWEYWQVCDEAAAAEAIAQCARKQAAAMKKQMGALGVRIVDDGAPALKWHPQERGSSSEC